MTDEFMKVNHLFLQNRTLIEYLCNEIKKLTKSEVSVRDAQLLYMKKLINHLALKDILFSIL